MIVPTFWVITLFGSSIPYSLNSYLEPFLSKSNTAEVELCLPLIHYTVAPLLLKQTSLTLSSTIGSTLHSSFVSPSPDPAFQLTNSSLSLRDTVITDSSFSHTTHPLYRSILADLNLHPSYFSSNTSFSHLDLNSRTLYETRQEFVSTNATFVSCDFGNIASEEEDIYGGAIYIESVNSILFVDDCTFFNIKMTGHPQIGGAICTMMDVVTTLIRTSFTETQGYTGGAVTTDVSTHVAVIACNLTNCEGVLSAGFCICGSLIGTVFDGCICTDNSASYSGAGLWIEVTNGFLVSNSLFKDNVGYYEGGAVTIGGPTYDESLVQSNSGNTRKSNIPTINPYSSPTKTSISSKTRAQTNVDVFPVFFHFCRFVNNTAGTCCNRPDTNWGHDINGYQYIGDRFGPENFVFCQTTRQTDMIKINQVDAATTSILFGYFHFITDTSELYVDGSSGSSSSSPDCGAEATPCSALVLAVAQTPFSSTASNAGSARPNSDPINHHQIILAGDTTEEHVSIADKSIDVEGRWEQTLTHTTANADPLFSLADGRLGLRKLKVKVDFSDPSEHSLAPVFVCAASHLGLDDVVFVISPSSAGSFVLDHPIGQLTNSVLVMTGVVVDGAGSSQASSPLFDMSTTSSMQSARNAERLSHRFTRPNSIANTSLSIPRPSSASSNSQSVVQYISLTNSKFSSITRTLGDGSCLSFTLPASSLTTMHCVVFEDCQTLHGNGGALSLTVTETATLQLDKLSFIRCKAACDIAKPGEDAGKGAGLMLNVEFAEPTGIQGNFVIFDFFFEDNQAEEDRGMFLRSPHLPGSVHPSKFALDHPNIALNVILGDEGHDTLVGSVIEILNPTHDPIWCSTDPSQTSADSASCGAETDLCATIDHSVSRWGGYKSSSSSATEGKGTVIVKMKSKITSPIAVISLLLKSWDENTPAVVTIDPIANHDWNAIPEPVLIEVSQECVIENIAFHFPEHIFLDPINFCYSLFLGATTLSLTSCSFEGERSVETDQPFLRYSLINTEAVKVMDNCEFHHFSYNGRSMNLWGGTILLSRTFSILVPSSEINGFHAHHITLDTASTLFDIYVTNYSLIATGMNLHDLQMGTTTTAGANNDETPTKWMYQNGKTIITSSHDLDTFLQAGNSATSFLSSFTPLSSTSNAGRSFVYISGQNAFSLGFDTLQITDITNIHDGTLITVDKMNQTVVQDCTITTLSDFTTGHLFRLATVYHAMFRRMTISAVSIPTLDNSAVATVFECNPIRYLFFDRCRFENIADWDSGVLVNFVGQDTYSYLTVNHTTFTGFTNMHSGTIIAACPGYRTIITNNTFSDISGFGSTTFISLSSMTNVLFESNTIENVKSLENGCFFRTTGSNLTLNHSTFTNLTNIENGFFISLAGESRAFVDHNTFTNVTGWESGFLLDIRGAAGELKITNETYSEITSSANSGELVIIKASTSVTFKQNSITDTSHSGPSALFSLTSSSTLTVSELTITTLSILGTGSLISMEGTSYTYCRSNVVTDTSLQSGGSVFMFCSVAYGYFDQNQFVSFESTSAASSGSFVSGAGTQSSSSLTIQNNVITTPQTLAAGSLVNVDGFNILKLESQTFSGLNALSGCFFFIAHHINTLTLKSIVFEALTTRSSGCLFFGTSIGTATVQSNTIQHCKFTGTAAFLSLGLTASGTASFSSNTITNTTLQSSQPFCAISGGSPTISQTTTGLSISNAPFLAVSNSKNARFTSCVFNSVNQITSGSLISGSSATQLTLTQCKVETATSVAHGSLFSLGGAGMTQSSTLSVSDCTLNSLSGVTDSSLITVVDFQTVTFSSTRITTVTSTDSNLLSFRYSATVTLSSTNITTAALTKSNAFLIDGVNSFTLKQSTETGFSNPSQSCLMKSMPNTSTEITLNQCTFSNVVSPSSSTLFSFANTKSVTVTSSSSFKDLQLLRQNTFFHSKAQATTIQSTTFSTATSLSTGALVKLESSQYYSSVPALLLNSVTFSQISGIEGGHVVSIAANGLVSLQSVTFNTVTGVASGGLLNLDLNTNGVLTAGTVTVNSLSSSSNGTLMTVSRGSTVTIEHISLTSIPTFERVGCLTVSNVETFNLNKLTIPSCTISSPNFIYMNSVTAATLSSLSLSSVKLSLHTTKLLVFTNCQFSTLKSSQMTLVQGLGEGYLLSASSSRSAPSLTMESSTFTSCSYTSSSSSKVCATAPAIHVTNINPIITSCTFTNPDEITRTPASCELICPVSFSCLDTPLLMSIKGGSSSITDTSFIRLCGGAIRVEGGTHQFTRVRFYANGKRLDSAYLDFSSNEKNLVCVQASIVVNSLYLTEYGNALATSTSSTWFFNDNCNIQMGSSATVQSNAAVAEFVFTVTNVKFTEGTGTWLGETSNGEQVCGLRRSNQDSEAGLICTVLGAKLLPCLCSIQISSSSSSSVLLTQFSEHKNDSHAVGFIPNRLLASSNADSKFLFSVVSRDGLVTSTPIEIEAGSHDVDPIPPDPIDPEEPDPEDPKSNTAVNVSLMIAMSSIFILLVGVMSVLILVLLRSRGMEHKLRRDNRVHPTELESIEASQPPVNTIIRPAPSPTPAPAPAISPQLARQDNRPAYTVAVEEEEESEWGDVVKWDEVEEYYGGNNLLQ
ncbi:hypothetical protein BLNAU_14971 [Blattamonas nauphoetae]|uniref:Uncharacterized protein n=1 Tax=Blattamonas nauphoetae TaxID=2049346 RepID=A0ABQ9XGS0_9EUKA|nr:hypothetical protein BLNAU_14971 [Blattamonas nauphoetae]